MSLQDQYQSKKCSPEEAVSHIKDHAGIFTGSEPVLLFKALFDQRHNYSDLHLYTMLGFSSRPVINETVLSPEAEGHFGLCSSTIGRGMRKAIKNGRKIDHLVTHFSNIEEMVACQIKPAYVLVHASPMDENGYFSMGIVPGAGRAAIDAGAKVVMQVNRNMPVLVTDYNRIHISEVTALCEGDTELQQVPDTPPTELEKIIAGIITEMIPNGATIQLGAGGVPLGVGNFLDSHKDLGIHTEVFTNSMKIMMEKGVVNNSRKSLYPGVTIAGFVQGTTETYDFVNNNKDILFRKLAWVNDPNTIAQVDNMISINSCLAIDLRAQVCSESIGTSTIAGIGGQLDFVRGVRKSKGGKSFIAVRSTMEKEDGTRLSKITLTLPEGSVVSTPRNDVMYVVTEFGCVELINRTAKEKALALISVAHPDFRDELSAQARSIGLI
jgi:4-hydroxybutyrate CoA-transferase